MILTSCYCDLDFLWLSSLLLVTVILTSCDCHFDFLCLDSLWLSSWLPLTVIFSSCNCHLDFLWPWLFVPTSVLVYCSRLRGINVHCTFMFVCVFFNIVSAQRAKGTHISTYITFSLRVMKKMKGCECHGMDNCLHRYPTGGRQNIKRWSSRGSTHHGQGRKDLGHNLRRLGLGDWGCKGGLQIAGFSRSRNGSEGTCGFPELHEIAFCLTVCLFVRVPVSEGTCGFPKLRSPSICLSVCLSACLCVYLTDGSKGACGLIFWPYGLSVCLSVCLSILHILLFFKYNISDFF